MTVKITVSSLPRYFIADNIGLSKHHLCSEGDDNGHGDDDGNDDEHGNGDDNGDGNCDGSGNDDGDDNGNDGADADDNDNADGGDDDNGDCNDNDDGDANDDGNGADNDDGDANGNGDDNGDDNDNGNGNCGGANNGDGAGDAADENNFCGATAIQLARARPRQAARAATDFLASGSSRRPRGTSGRSSRRLFRRAREPRSVQEQSYFHLGLRLAPPSEQYLVQSLLPLSLARRGNFPSQPHPIVA